ncbi:MAG: peptide-methionine (S)-S-oxide reductase [Pseudomonadota bacterium]|jgi:peptide-methionine (S)-S-oxide reductase
MTDATTHIAAAPHPSGEQATLAGGCFWCLEAAFNQLKGVILAESGYANGHHPSPTYDDICTGTTGHAEVVRVWFDPSQLSYGDLLDVFFALHDPTTLNRQGHDVGTQYRSGIYTHDANQATAAREKISALTAEGVFDAPIVTEVAPVANYHAAEAYHQGYALANPHQPYCAYVVSPKLAKFRQAYARRLKAPGDR